MKKRKLKPWVKITLAFIIGVISVSQIYKSTIGTHADTGKEEILSREALHGVVEMTSEDKAYLTIIEKDMGVGEIEIPNDTYFNGDLITVIYDDKGSLTNSYRTSEKEIESLKTQHGAMYRMLLEKHDRYIE